MKRDSLNSVADLKKVKVSKNRVRAERVGGGGVGGGGYGREIHSMANLVLMSRDSSTGPLQLFINISFL